MPLWITQQPTSGLVFGIWQIEETEAFFWERLSAWYTEEDVAHLSNPQRRLQWLAARLLLNQLCEKNGIHFSGTQKDKFQKVFLNDSTAAISVSHTDYFAAVALHMNGDVGIDLEKIDNRAERIARRFLHDEEWLAKPCSDADFTFYWAAKEAVYKWHGRKQLIFKEEILIRNSAEAILYQQGSVQPLRLYHQTVEGLSLVVAF